MRPITLGPQSGMVYDNLRERIVTGAVAPGAQLPSQKELAHQFGVAPMTVRQALMRLADEGLVAAKMGCGTYVSPALDAGDRDAASTSATRHGLRLADTVVVVDESPAGDSDMVETVRQERRTQEVAADRLGRLQMTSIAFAQARTPEAVAAAPIGIDISEQKKAEDALAASEQRYRSVVEASLDGILMTDLSGTIIFANRQMASLVALSSAEELTGQHVVELICVHDRDAVVCEMENLVKQGSVTDLPFALIRVDGTSFPCELSASLVFGAGGMPSAAAVIIRDMTERHAHEEQLRRQALHDPLTDLPNRTLFNDRLAQVLLAARREEDPFALLLLDLDRFKEVNDTLGHQAGDILLQQAAGRLRDALRESDTVARLGGDEFAIILPNADEQGAIQAINALLNDCAEPLVAGEHPHYLEFNIGVALFPQHAEDVAALLRCATVAMYTAKRSGAAYALYESKSDPNSERRLALMAGLRRAIDEDQLVLHYQPKVNLQTGRASQVEALVRWNHPQFGLIPPDQFISLAEHTGLIRPMSRWILNEALRQIAGWRVAGHDIAVAVNLSTCNLQESDLVDRITKLLTKWGVSAPSLRIEITESTLMADPDRAMATLTLLHDMGIRVSIDDFGTGYSSLAYLQRLSADEVKIDRTFVAGMSTPGSGSSSIVRSVVDLGHTLGLRVVAEGVETQQDLDILGAMGCDVAQGYYLGKPMPGSEYVAWLDTWDQRGWFLPAGAAAS
jgi:diguanylate cyclase (GGDEF)-like protein/PAS domain S-box-containing protein